MEDSPSCCGTLASKVLKIEVESEFLWKRVTISRTDCSGRKEDRASRGGRI